MTQPTVLPETEDRQLPAEVEDVLVTFSRALERIGLYPPGHPAVDPLVGQVHGKLERVLDQRGPLSVGVAPDVLVLDEAATDSTAPTLRDLTRRLHGHELARLTFHPTPGRQELAELLAALSCPPEEEGALGSRPYPGGGWPHVTVEPVPYDRIGLSEEDGAEAAREESTGGAEELWRSLAGTVLGEESAPQTDEELPEPDRIAEALEEGLGDERRARDAAAGLASVAGALQRQGPAAAPEVRDRFVELMQSVEPDALRRMFEAAPPAADQALMEAAAEWMPAETVLELIQAVARDEDHDLSYHVLRLLTKLAERADSEEGDPQAERSFRAHVRQLLVGWRPELEAPSGGQQARWSDVLQRGRTEREAMRDLVGPERVVQTALELGHLGSAGQEAVDELLRHGDVAVLVGLLRTTSAAGETREAVWDRMSTPATLRHLLDAGRPDFEAVDELLCRLGERAAAPMLDALAEATSRPVRRELFSRLAELEGTIEGQILERTADDRWFVKRNMLALLAERDVQPVDFSPLEHATHPRAAVRREAYRLALRRADEREEAIRRALQDPDSRAAAMAFGALDEVEPSILDRVLPTLVERLSDETLAPEIRRLGLAALSRAEATRALEVLLSFCRVRTVWRFWTTQLADKSPLMLGALRALRRGWSEHPEARDVLEEARTSDDPEVREAAGEGPTRREAA